jgi:hypothetical protein
LPLAVLPKRGPSVNCEVGGLFGRRSGRSGLAFLWLRRGRGYFGLDARLRLGKRRAEDRLQLRADLVERHQLQFELAHRRVGRDRNLLPDGGEAGHIDLHRRGPVGQLGKGVEALGIGDGDILLAGLRHGDGDARRGQPVEGDEAVVLRRHRSGGRGQQQEHAEEAQNPSAQN